MAALNSASKQTPPLASSSPPQTSPFKSPPQGGSPAKLPPAGPPQAADGVRQSREASPKAVVTASLADRMASLEAQGRGGGVGGGAKAGERGEGVGAGGGGGRDVGGMSLKSRKEVRETTRHLFFLREWKACTKRCQMETGMTQNPKMDHLRPSAWICGAAAPAFLALD